MNTKARVPTAQTGESASDGGTQGIKMPPALGHNVLTESGRHFKNSRTADVGTIRSGQSEPDGNHPITGVSKDSPIRSMAPVPSIPANQAETSKNLEQVLVTPPTPFKYEGGAATLLPGSVRFAEVGIGYEYKSEPDAPLSKRGYGVEPMGKQAMEDAASAGGGMPSKGYNPINGGRAPWMRKD